MQQKIVLGTAQFGLSYGVANNSGQISIQESKKIIQLAKNAKINKIDTAMAYGNSEKSLGNIGVLDWKVITKISEAPPEVKNIKSWVRNEIQDSLNRLGVSELYAVMLHNTSILSFDNVEEYWNSLRKLKQQGVIKKIGYSIYDPSELNEFYNRYHPDIIQAPYNIVDNRLNKSGWLQKLSDDLVEVHIRSVFLQGLLLMKKNQRPLYFKKWNQLWGEWHKWLEEQKITALEATLGFVYDDPRISNLVIGVDNAKQLGEIIDISAKKIKIEMSNFSSMDQKLIDPSRWRL